MEARTIGIENRVHSIEAVMFGDKDSVGETHMIKELYRERGDLLKVIESLRGELVSVNNELAKYKWWLRGVIAAISGIVIATGWMLSTWTKLISMWRKP